MGSNPIRSIVVFRRVSGRGGAVRPSLLGCIAGAGGSAYCVIVRRIVHSNLLACVAVALGLVSTMAGGPMLVICSSAGGHTAVELAHPDDEHCGEPTGQGFPAAPMRLTAGGDCEDVPLLNDAPVLPDRYRDMAFALAYPPLLGASWLAEQTAGEPACRFRGTADGEASDRPGMAPQVVRRVVLLI